MYKQIIVVLVACLSLSAYAAKVEVDKGQNDPFFRVEGAKASAEQAVEAYHSGKDVEKCSPVKGAVNSSGSVSDVFKCKSVKRVLNARNGNETWKAK